jgi:hypothetical protein
MDAVCSLDKVPPTRSTIPVTTGMAHISSCHMPPLSFSELKKDIVEIEWQECPIGSVMTVNPVALRASVLSISAESCLTVLPGKYGRRVDMVRKRINRDEETDKEDTKVKV